MADIQAWIDAHLPPTPIRRTDELRVIRAKRESAAISEIWSSAGSGRQSPITLLRQARECGCLKER